mmetsp:Transcript_6933/g.18736  ORF Transcript_6933/g.18736 Transcript_6933/m.18736 type:complete len:249 (+) Transcript_6933:167-913(+)
MAKTASRQWSFSIRSSFKRCLLSCRKCSWCSLRPSTRAWFLRMCASLCSRSNSSARSRRTWFWSTSSCMAPRCSLVRSFSSFFCCAILWSRWAMLSMSSLLFSRRFCLISRRRALCFSLALSIFECTCDCLSRFLWSTDSFACPSFSMVLLKASSRWACFSAASRPSCSILWANFACSSSAWACCCCRWLSCLRRVRSCFSWYLMAISLCCARSCRSFRCSTPSNFSLRSRRVVCQPSTLFLCVSSPF